MSSLQKAKAEIVKVVATVYRSSPLLVSDIGPTPSPALGDLAVPMFKLAKVAGKPPGEIAELVREHIGKSPYIAEATVAGPYLNVRLNQQRIIKETLATILKEKSKYGNAKKNKERVMVEYISANPNKPIHLGHLRNAVIGGALIGLLETTGNKVITAQLVNDRGLSISKAMVAYERWGESKTPASAGIKGDHFVGDFYVMFEKQKANHPDMEVAALDKIKKWEEGDTATRALWRTMIKWTLDGQKQTYKTLGVKFDKAYRESIFYTQGKKMVEDGLAKGILSKDEKGNTIAQIPGLPDKVVLRADGTAIYITTDMAVTVKKVVENKLNRCIWILGSEQKVHFKQLFGILRLYGYSWVDDLEVLSYGLVNLPEGRMKSREGTVVDADDLIEKLSELAATEVRSRHDFLNEKEVQKRATEIALGALKYYLLSVNAPSDMVFDPKESLSFTGKTGPYLQYTNARILSLLRKAVTEKSKTGRVDVAKLTEPSEWQLILALAQFPEVISNAANTREPALLAKYSYDLAKTFSDFYENVPVLKADEAVRRARLCLIRAVQSVLSRSLSILGIPTPKEM